MVARLPDDSTGAWRLQANAERTLKKVGREAIPFLIEAVRRRSAADPARQTKPMTLEPDRALFGPLCPEPG